MLNKSFALEVIGDEMEPVLLWGDEVVVNPNLVPATNGKDLAVVEINGNYHICRLVKFGRQMLLLHDNGPTMAIWRERVRIVGKVIENENSHSAENTLAIA